MENKCFNEVTNEWLELKKLSVKYSSLVKYEVIIKTHITPFFNSYSIHQINDELILSFFNMMHEKQKLANSTLITIRYVLKSIGHYIQIKYSTKGLNMDLIKITKQPSKVVTLTDSQKIQLSNYCFNHHTPISIAVLIALYGGLRIGEICALKWEDIDLNESYICVNQTIERLKSKNIVESKTSLMSLSPKTMSSKRVVPIPIFLLEYIQKYRENINIEDTNHYILTNSHKIPDPRTTQYRFTKLCKQFNFSINFHALRHSYATHCVMQEIDTKSLSEMLGHSTVGTTLNLYVHSSLDFKRKQIGKLSKH